jgi:hypothetical protein
MRRNFAILSIALVITLSAAGLVYAHWTDMLYISGTIETDTLNLAWTDIESVSALDNEIPIKDYAWGEAEFLDQETDAQTGLIGYETLKLDVYNAYPGYYIRFTDANLKNIGTTPLDLLSITVEVCEDTSPGTNLKWKWLQEPYRSPIYGVVYNDTDGDDMIDIDEEEIMWVQFKSYFAAGPNNKGIQLHPGDEFKGEIDIYFLQPMKECYHYCFYVTIVGVQWNWDPAIGPYTVPLPPVVI